MKIKEIEAKSIFVPSKLPGTDYVVNAYTGCLFGCAYCYASFMGRSVGEDLHAWGNYVYVKKNAVELARKELARWSEQKRQRSIFFSSVTDPYHGIERKYELTRGVLRTLGDSQYPGSISILTKGPLVLRDIDIIKNLRNVEVGLTVTSTHDDIARMLEVHAPPSLRRLEVLTELKKAGISTYAFVGPLMPHYRYFPERLEELFHALNEAGVSAVFVEHMNMKPYIRERLFAGLAHEKKEIREIYREARHGEHQLILNNQIQELLQKYKMELLLGEVIEHAS